MGLKPQPAKIPQFSQGMFPSQIAFFYRQQLQLFPSFAHPIGPQISRHLDWGEMLTVLLANQSSLW